MTSKFAPNVNQKIYPTAVVDKFISERGSVPVLRALADLSNRLIKKVIYEMKVPNI